jgi:hypothetical protein
MAETPAAVRRSPYAGSCHCGTIKYIVFITSPPCLRANASNADADATRIRKCNCSSCHKMGFFHVRPVSPSDDFLLLSPIAISEGGVGGPFGNGLGEGLSNYTCFDALINWWFCKKCGVRCFASSGESEVVKIELEKWKGQGEGQGILGSGVTRAWRMKKKDPGTSKANEYYYLSVNAQTLDNEQDGIQFDLREWYEKKWVNYIDCKGYKEENRFERPFEGGTY